MDDLVDSVLVQLRVHDGCGAMSILWYHSRTNSVVLITPVQKDARTSYDVRIACSTQSIKDGRFDGFNITEAVDVARFFLQHVKSKGSNELVDLRFVSTLDPEDGLPHTIIKVDDVDGFVQLLKAVTSMRPLACSLTHTL
jgi:hypothetical protein